MNFRFKALLCISLTVVPAFGQDVDSLIAKLESLPAGESRVDLLNKVVSTLRERNVYTAVKYGSEAKNLAEKLDYQKGLGLALENLGWIYYRRGVYSSAYDLSQRALKIQAERGDSVAIARCLNNVGAISYEKGEYDEAIQHFKNGYLLAEGGDDAETVVRSINNVAFAFLSLHNTDSAIHYANMALDKSGFYRQGYLPAFSFRILGDIAIETGDLSAAHKYYMECMRISEETNNYFIQASTLHRIGKLYFKQGNFNRALEVLNQNVKLAKQNGYADELERTYKLISDINTARNNIGQAFEYLKKHLALHDSLISQRNNEQMALLSTQFETELKQSQIELLTKNSKIKEEELKSQKAWNSFYIGCIVLGLVIAIILYYSYQRIKKVNAQLEEKTNEVGEQASQLSNINKTKDKLLSIISHDIRSPLSSLRGMLHIAQSGNATRDEFAQLTAKIGTQLDSVYEDLGNLLQWTQTQLQGLKVNSETFDLKNLASEATQLFDSAAKTKKIQIKNEILETVHVVADVNHVRLIFRNFISNAIKFSSESGEIIIRQERNGAFSKISICDKGIGISEEEISKLFNASTHISKTGTANEKGMGVGLLLTKEFIEKNGGSVFVESELGKGSCFTFTLPAA